MSGHNGEVKLSNTFNLNISKFYHCFLRFQILDLPDEMIAEILFYIPDQLSIGQTCLKFYEISCQNSFFKLCLPTGNDLTNEKEVFESMMSSKRRIKHLKLGCRNKSCNSFLEDVSIIKVIKHFASDVKILHLNSVIINNSFIDILNLMTNLTLLKLYKVSINKKLKVCKLKLHKLEEIISSESSAGVLKKIELLWYTEKDEIHKNNLKQVDLLKNQQNIREIVAHSFLNLITKLRLNSLLYEDYLNFNIQDSLKAQNELKSLTSYSLNPGDLKFICAELTSLEFLHGNFCEISSNEFSHFYKLKLLRNLRISWDHGGYVYEKNSESLFVMCSESLTDLEINCDKVMDSALIQVGTNCLNLRRLTFDANMSTNIFKLFVKHFKKLRCLVLQVRSDESDQINPETDSDPISPTEKFENKTLENLSVFGSYNDIKSRA